jgi:hypothetical protein
VGASGDATLTVTQNLGNALPYRRYPNEARYLRINAICVNQGDVKERSEQIQLMAQIYAAATRVLIWLGPELASSKLAFDTVEEVRIAAKFRVWKYHAAKLGVGLN